MRRSRLGRWIGRLAVLAALAGALFGTAPSTTDDFEWNADFEWNSVTFTSDGGN